MKLTGHKTIVMFTRYNTVDRDDARLAMEMLYRFLEGAEGSYNAPEGVDTKKQGHRVPIFISLWLPGQDSLRLRSGQAHFLCEDALVISSSFFFLVQPFRILSRLTASSLEKGPSWYRGAIVPCWRMRFSKSVVIPTYSFPLFSIR